MGWLEPPTIPSEKLRLLKNVRLWHFGLLTSRMHMAWMRTVTGRLKSDYMYSVSVVYNAFPLPPVDDKALAKIEPLAQSILDARKKYTGSLADLYDPLLMPGDQRRAHRVLDRAFDRLCRGSAFGSDRERVEHLFGLYEKLITPLAATAQAKPRRTKLRAAAE